MNRTYIKDVTPGTVKIAGFCENIRNKMARMNVNVDVSAIPGGQPVYYYFISVE